jgi:hypothetical protein
MTQESNLFISIGKQIKDEYGRTMGKVASLAVNPNGRVDSAYVEQGDGRIIKYPAESLKVEGSEVILLSTIKMKATTFGDQIPLIWRKNQALKGLVEKNKISPEVYEDLHGSFEGVLSQLKNEAQNLTEEINKETARCAQEIKELNYALVNLEIEHEIGKIDEQSYQTAFAIIQECLKSTNMKKSDLESMKSKLSNILLGETQLQTEQEGEEEPAEELEAQEDVPTPLAPSPSLPEPPVVVYVKEVGKSST